MFFIKRQKLIFYSASNTNDAIVVDERISITFKGGFLVKIMFLAIIYQQIEHIVMRRTRSRKILVQKVPIPEGYWFRKLIHTETW